MVHVVNCNTNITYYNELLYVDKFSQYFMNGRMLAFFKNVEYCFRD